MRSDDDDDVDVKHNGASQAKPTRNARGHWLKGHCPNPKGRPRKKVDPTYDPRNIRHFGNTVIEIRVNGQIELMDRRTAVLHRMFEDAMKGKVSTQRFLYAEFERNDLQLTQARHRYQQLIIRWVIENDNFDGRDGDSIPVAIQLEILGLEAFLHHHFPSQYPDPRGTDRSEDPDEDDG